MEVYRNGEPRIYLLKKELWQQAAAQLEASGSALPVFTAPLAARNRGKDRECEPSSERA